jgi:hypothetical protein
MFASMIPMRPRGGDAAFVAVLAGQADRLEAFAEALGADPFHARRLLMRSGHVVFQLPTGEEAAMLLRRLEGVVRAVTFDQATLDALPRARDIVELRIADGGAAGYRSESHELFVRDKDGIEEGVRLADIGLVVADQLVSVHWEKKAQIIVTAEGDMGSRVGAAVKTERQHEARRVMDLYDARGGAFRCVERRVRISGLGLRPQEGGHAFRALERWLTQAGLRFIGAAQTDVRTVAGRLSTSQEAAKKDDFATWDLRSARAWIVEEGFSGEPGA